MKSPSLLILTSNQSEDAEIGLWDHFNVTGSRIFFREKYIMKVEVQNFSIRGLKVIKKL